MNGIDWLAGEPTAFAIVVVTAHAESRLESSPNGD